MFVSFLFLAVKNIRHVLRVFRRECSPGHVARIVIVSLLQVDEILRP